MEEQNTQGQPHPGQAASPFHTMPRPKNWLIESILVTIFCCLPLGIVSIVNAVNVNSKFDAGDYAGAQRASKEAGKWVKWSFISGIIIAILYVVFIVILGMGAAFMSTGYN